MEKKKKGKVSQVFFFSFFFFNFSNGHSNLADFKRRRQQYHGNSLSKKLGPQCPVQGWLDPEPALKQELCLVVQGATTPSPANLGWGFLT